MKKINGITYMHEHITIDLSGVKQDEDCRLDDFENTVEELKELKELGVKNIVDVTNRGMGRNVEYAMRAAKKADINVIFSTGYYKEPFLPKEVYELSEKELSMIMVKEILCGIEDTGIKAKFIGEVGTSKNYISPVEKKLLISSALANIETGSPITTHTTLGTCGIEQIEILKTYDVNLDKVIIGHVDLSDDLDYILALIDKGVFVAFDTIGKVNYLKEEKRLKMLREICNRGLSERVVMSMDITRKSHLKDNGGLGYSYLLKEFIPYINDNGISDSDIYNMLVNNPKKFLS